MSQNPYFRPFRVEIPISNHAESDQRSKILYKHSKAKKFDFFAKKFFFINLRTLAKMLKFENAFSQKWFEQYR